ncbi:MAG: AraC family transcriptional regulator [Bacteroidaceae bacterium]|nr:AraC family transcriptional regulator [Bacteroidaceae bacterium]
MTQLHKMSITQLSDVEDLHLVTYPGFAINQGVRIASAVGHIMKQGEPYRLMENRIVRVLNGCLKLSVNLIEYKVIDNESLYVGQNSIVEILDYTPDTVVDIMGFTLAADNENIKCVYKLNAECAKWIEIYFQLIYATAQALPFENRSIHHLLMSLHSRIVEDSHTHSNEHAHPKGRKEQFFHSFIELLNSISGKHELSFYANRLNISSQYLSRLTAETSGITAGDWINRAVILQAKLLLRNKELTIEQIAEKLNISTLPYFCRLFKREVGITPSQYRITKDTK